MVYLLEDGINNEDNLGLDLKSQTIIDSTFMLYQYIMYSHYAVLSKVFCSHLQLLRIISLNIIVGSRLIVVHP